MNDLERRLVDLGGSIAFPPGPDLVPAVRERIAVRPRRAPWLERRTLAIALAVLAVSIGAAMAVPQARTAILDFFGLRGLVVERVETLPEVSNGGKIGFGEAVPLAEAERLAGFDVFVPEALGEANRVFFDRRVAGGQVALVYDDKPGYLFTQFRGEGEPDIFKKLLAPGTQMELLTVDGGNGVWFSGDPHVFGYIDREGNFQSEPIRFAGNTLVWERGPFLLRLEAEIPQEEALRIASSTK